VRFRPELVRTIFIGSDTASSARVRPICEAARNTGIAVESVAGNRLTELCGTPRHHGIVAHCEPFPYASIDSILAVKPALLLVVDQLQDPQNLGAILRTAEAAGVGGVILPRDSTVSVTPAAEAAAVGAAATVPVCQVTNLARSLAFLRDQHYWVAGLSAQARDSIFAVQIPMPLVVVVGGEVGMRRLVAASCDIIFSIPMCGVVESLNASVAASVALYEVHRRLNFMPGS